MQIKKWERKEPPRKTTIILFRNILDSGKVEYYAERDGEFFWSNDLPCTEDQAIFSINCELVRLGLTQV
jgi:hypothetical protein